MYKKWLKLENIKNSQFDNFGTPVNRMCNLKIIVVCNTRNPSFTTSHLEGLHTAVAFKSLILQHHEESRPILSSQF